MGGEKASGGGGRRRPSGKNNNNKKKVIPGLSPFLQPPGRRAGSLTGEDPTEQVGRTWGGGAPLGAATATTSVCFGGCRHNLLFFIFRLLLSPSPAPASPRSRARPPSLPPAGSEPGLRPRRPFNGGPRPARPPRAAIGRGGRVTPAPPPRRRPAPRAPLARSPPPRQPPPNVPAGPRCRLAAPRPCRFLGAPGSWGAGAAQTGEPLPRSARGLARRPPPAPTNRAAPGGARATPVGSDEAGRREAGSAARRGACLGPGSRCPTRSLFCPAP